MANAVTKRSVKRDLAAGVGKERAEENLSIGAVHLKQDPRAIRTKCIWMNGVLYAQEPGV
jgi:hypothetical protein